MSQLITLIKCNLISQIRNYRFFVIIGISIFLGFLCVPSTSAGYEIFYLGGVRGLYNSAWLGALGAMLPVILLWLPGFYLLRSQITADSDMKIGQIIASAPVSNLRYLFGKFATNFSILIVLHLAFLTALIAMQFIQHESMTLSLMRYIEPLILVTAPYLLVLSALTLLFDVVSFLKGALGNIVIFVLWIILSILSVANPCSHFDLFGMGMLLNAMLQGAKVYFPNLPDTASFGYYTIDTDISTFMWNGITWNKNFLQSRLVWVVIALLISLISAAIFNRFKESSHRKKNNRSQPITIRRRLESPSSLSTIKKNTHLNLTQIIFGELKIMLYGHPIWWYLTAMVIMALTPFSTSGESLKWVSLSMLIPISIWSQMGNRDKSSGTYAFIASSCSSSIKWIATWLSGIIVSVLMSLGMIARIVILSEWNHLPSWVVGMVFIPTLALILGSMSGSRRLFEAVFIALMYLGIVNDMWNFDFMGLSSNNAAFYTTITILLLSVGIITQLSKEKRPLRAWR